MKRSASRSAFTAIRTEGGILPAELLERLGAGDKDLPGLTPEDFHLGPQERLGEAVNRSWSRLRGAWSAFRDARAKLPPDDPATRVTRERWLLPLFQELGFGRLLRANALEIDGKSFAVSHGWHRSPIHLLGAGISLDYRAPGVAGAAMASPHGLVQEVLNRSDDRLWGYVSNGLALRVLRDHHSLTRQAYVELDLESIMAGELYSEFLLVWLVCHQSRVDAEKPEDCWLERWFQLARDEGVRALHKLRDGVKTAITALGQGFLRHRANRSLHQALENGGLDGQEYYRELLRLVYRLIFLFVAEDRDALLDPSAAQEAKDRYLRFYATRHLRRLADRQRGGPHGDLWHGLRLVMEKLGEGCPELALPALGSFLWRREAVPHLAGCELGNSDLLAAFRTLGTIEDRGSRYPVNWRNVGSEELGSIYESLLELRPRLHREAATFELASAAGHERKTTGSYYTPASLVECLLDSALDPVLDEAAVKPDPEQAILDLKVCDPACGSGHFLVAAARRIANRLAAVRSGDAEPSPQAVQHALRDVVGRCLYGVDVNPMAVELCKVSLWMEALEPGRPLSFLDHHVQCGNSLLGATPELMEQGIPDDAFKPIEGDDKGFCAEFRKRNKQERETRQQQLFDAAGKPWERLGDLMTGMLELSELGDETIEAVRLKEDRYKKIVESRDYEFGRLWADAWCAAFVWEKVETQERPYPITEEVFRRIERNPYSVPPWLKDEVKRQAGEYRLFHWHLAFPGILRPVSEKGGSTELQVEWGGGFDLILGNPPWEQTELKEKEWFAERSLEIANAPTGALRKTLIRALRRKNPDLYFAFSTARRGYDAANLLVRNSGRFPLTARGRTNTYALFAELNYTLISGEGRVGCIVPTGIATDAGMKYFFRELIENKSLVSMHGFFEIRRMFPGTDSRDSFALLTLAGRAKPVESAEVAFELRRTEDLKDEQRTYILTADDIKLFNPNTRTCPIFRNRRDARIARAIYNCMPVLVKHGTPVENPWQLNFRQGLFNLTSDSDLFRSSEQLESDGWMLDGNRFFKNGETYLPLYESKMTHHFNHRFGDYRYLPISSTSSALPAVPRGRLRDPLYVPLPRYWVPATTVKEKLVGCSRRGWFLGWRDICRSDDERTVIGSVIPRLGVGNNLPISILDQSSANHAALVACISSFVFDFVARFKVGGTHLNFFITEQLPALPPTTFDEKSSWNACRPLIIWIQDRVLELTFTAWDLQPFAHDCGYDGPPFRWDEDRRFLLRCELDAAFFHLYGIERDDVDYIMETFPIVTRKDVRKHGDYRTKLQILDIYDRMQRAIDTGEPYQTVLDPPPADPRVAHPPRDAEPAKAATVLAFPSRPPEDDTYPLPEPALLQVAEPEGPPYGDDEDADTPAELKWLDGVFEPADATPAERILGWLRERPGWHARADVLAELGDLSAAQWNEAIRELVSFGEVERRGEKRGTRYRASPDVLGES